MVPLWICMYRFWNSVHRKITFFFVNHLEIVNPLLGNLPVNKEIRWRILIHWYLYIRKALVHMFYSRCILSTSQNFQRKNCVCMYTKTDQKIMHSEIFSIWLHNEHWPSVFSYHSLTVYYWYNNIKDSVTSEQKLN